LPTEKDGAETSDPPLIGELDELGEPRIRVKMDPTDELLNSVVSQAEPGLGFEEYQLSDPDFVRKAIRAGYLILPARSSTEPLSTPIPPEAR
jgi:hypothetical protein